MTNGTATENDGTLTLTYNENMQIDKDGTRDSAVDGRAKPEPLLNNLQCAKYAL